MAATPQKEAPKPPSTNKQVMGILEARKDEIAKMAGKVLSVDRLFRISVNAIAKTPKLMLCTPASLVQSIITCAEWGLEPNTASQHAYLVPRRISVKDTNGKHHHFEDQCSAQLGYRGMIELFRRSGMGEQIWADVVYEGEPWRWTKRTTNEGRFVFDFEHDQTEGASAGASIIKAYAIAVFKGGGVQGVKLEKWEIEKIAAVSEAKSGPWDSWEEEMAKKSAIRRLSKYLPTTPDLDEKLAKDQVVEGEVMRREEPEVVRAPPAPATAKGLPERTSYEVIDFEREPERELAPLQSEEAPVQADQRLAHDPVTGVVAEEPRGDDPDSWTERMIAKMQAAPDLNALMALSKEVKNGPADRAIDLMAAYQKAKDALKAKGGA